MTVWSGVRLTSTGVGALDQPKSRTWSAKCEPLAIAMQGSEDEDEFQHYEHTDDQFQFARGSQGEVSK
jgi:hypothetical protein